MVIAVLNVLNRVLPRSTPRLVIHSFLPPSSPACHLHLLTIVPICRARLLVQLVVDNSTYCGRGQRAPRTRCTVRRQTYSHPAFELSTTDSKTAQRPRFLSQGIRAHNTSAFCISSPRLVLFTLQFPPHSIPTRLEFRRPDFHTSLTKLHIRLTLNLFPSAQYLPSHSESSSHHERRHWSINHFAFARVAAARCSSLTISSTVAPKPTTHAIGVTDAV